MLSYAMVPLKESGYRKTSIEGFSHIEDLFAMILERGISNLKKSGLLSDYENKEEDLAKIRGKIKISEAVSIGIFFKRRLVCKYDEWTENSYLNKILKAFLFHLIFSKEVQCERRENLRKLVPFFNNVDLLPIYKVKWNKVKYNCNNATYKMLIDVCKFIYDSTIFTTENGIIKRLKFNYEKTLHSIYEKFLLEYFKYHYPEYKVYSPYISWSLDDGYSDRLLPAMKSDIVIINKKNNNKLIIDAKFYTKSMSTGKFGESNKLHSQHLYQIYTYVKNEQCHSLGNVSGVLLYARTDETIIPNGQYSFDNNKIAALTIDLNQEFEGIKKALNAIIEKWS